MSDYMIIEEELMWTHTISFTWWNKYWRSHESSCWYIIVSFYLNPYEKL